MKKIMLLVSAVAGLLFAGSCQRENLEVAGDGMVTITVEKPDVIGTKATIADGENVDELHYAIYKTKEAEEHAVDVEGSTPLAQGCVGMSGKTAEVTFNLLQDQYYTVIFWAQVSGKNHYELGDLRRITIKDNAVKVAGNDESRAAFFAKYEFNTEENKDHKVNLLRPFSQLNLLTTMESITPEQPGQTSGYEVDVKKSEVIIKGLSTTFNTVSGLGMVPTDATAEFKYEMYDTPAKQGYPTLEVNGVKYHYVSMNYLFVPVEGIQEPDKSALVDVSYTIDTDMGPVAHSLTNVPVKENYRTNVIGNLLTKETTFIVIVQDKFEGTYIGEPFYELPPTDENTGALVVSNPDQLRYLIHGGNELDGQTVELAADIDMQNETWTPAGSSETPFKGTFDGKGFKISNLTVSDSDRAALFAYVGEGATIRNVTLENVDIVSTKYAAGLVCEAGNDVVIENVKVSGNINATSYAAGIIMMNTEYTAVTVRNCENSADIKAQRAAGIAAWVDYNTKIENVVNYGNITSTIGASGVAHAFAGSMKNAVNHGEITSTGIEPASGVAGVQKGTSTYEYCYNYGKVLTTANDSNSSAAGILGQTPNTVATLIYCANYGDITAEQSYAGGIAYSLYGSIRASYCYNEGTINGADGAGAIAPKAEYAIGDTASYCLNAGNVVSSNTVYQGSNSNESCYYYNGNELLNVNDNSIVSMDDALAVLNGGSDNSFFTTDNGKIVVNN